MQGSGVIQYDANKTSHAIGTATTQFDDELMKRNIVTAEQVYLAKGAKSLEEAQRLANERREQRKPQAKYVYDISTKQDKEEEGGTDDDNDEYDDLLDDDDDDAFFARYRQQRLAQLKQEGADQEAKRQGQQQQNFPIRIQREEWTTRVNQASHLNWVLVCLWDDSSMRTQDILQDLVRLQQEREQSDVHQLIQDQEDDSDSEDGERRSQYPSNRIEIVTIEYQQANPHWPSARVPAIFAYRNGIKQHEWVTNKAGKFPTREQLQIMLLEWGI